MSIMTAYCAPNFDTLPLELKARVACFLLAKSDQANFRLIQRKCADVTTPALFHTLKIYIFMSDLNRLESLGRSLHIAALVEHVQFEVAYLPNYGTFAMWKRYITESSCSKAAVDKDHKCKFDYIRDIYDELDKDALVEYYATYQESLTDQQRLISDIDSGRLQAALKALPKLNRIDINSSAYSIFDKTRLHNIEAATLTTLETLATAQCTFNDSIHRQVLNAIHEANMAIETVNFSEAPMSLFCPQKAISCNFDSSDFKSLSHLRLLTGCPASPESLSAPVTGNSVYERLLKSANNIDELTIGANGVHGQLLAGVGLSEIFPRRSTYYKKLTWLNLDNISVEYEDLTTALWRLKDSLEDITLSNVFLEQKDWISVFQFLATTKITKTHFDHLLTKKGMWHAIACSEGPCQGKTLPKESLFMRMWDFFLEKKTECPLQSLEENEDAEKQWLEQSDDTMHYSVMSEPFVALPMAVPSWVLQHFDDQLNDDLSDSEDQWDESDERCTEDDEDEEYDEYDSENFDDSDDSDMPELEEESTQGDEPTKGNNNEFSETEKGSNQSDVSDESREKRVISS